MSWKRNKSAAEETAEADPLNESEATPAPAGPITGGVIHKGVGDEAAKEETAEVPAAAPTGPIQGGVVHKGPGDAATEE